MHKTDFITYDFKEDIAEVVAELDERYEVTRKDCDKVGR